MSDKLNSVEPTSRETVTPVVATSVNKGAILQASPVDSTENVGPLLTRNIFLDTQAIYSENFKYESRNLRELKERASAAQLKVFITDINEREIRAGIRKRVNEAVNVFTSKDRSGARILSNLPGEYDLLFDRDKASEAIEKLTKQFDQFLVDAKVEVVSSRHLTLGAIFDRYFDARPPFEGPAEKKSEFPDAVSVAAVVHWTDVNASDTYLVTGDGGVRSAAKESSRVHPVGSIAEVLARATVSYAEAPMRSMAQAAYAKLTTEIERIVAMEFESLEFSWRDYDYGNPAVDSVSAVKVRLGSALLTEMDDAVARFELEVTVSYRAALRYDDPDATVYDREDRELRVFNRIHAEATARVLVPVAISVAFDPLTGDGQLFDVEVNDNQTLDIATDEIEEVGSDIDDGWDRDDPEDL